MTFLKPLLPLASAMPRPEGVVANARSEARLATVPSLSTMALLQGKTISASTSIKPAEVPQSNAHGVQPCFRVATHHARSLGLTRQQMLQITGGRDQSDVQQQPWKYDQRWQAQAITDFLYLGPFKMASNRDFLVDHKITKMIAVRDTRFADARMLYYDQLASSLGIDMECLDVQATSALVADLPRAVQCINSHMLAVPVDESGASTGKVFVFCETGNIRAAAVVLAYIMSMYGESMQECWRFVTLRRFCVGLDEDTKQMLVAYEQLFRARVDVQRQEQADEDLNVTTNVRMNQDQDQDMSSAGPSPLITTPATSDSDRGDNPVPLRAPSQGPFGATLGVSVGVSRAKRSIEETMDTDDDRIGPARLDGSRTVSREPSAEPARPNLDSARYENRANFRPFSDVGTGTSWWQLI